MKVTKERKLAELKRLLVHAESDGMYRVRLKELEESVYKLRVAVLTEIIADYEADKLANVGEQASLF